MVHVSPIFEKSVKKIRKAGEKAAPCKCTVMACSGFLWRKAVVECLFECRGRKLRSIFLELVAKAHGAHLQAPLNQMIEDIQERVPSWLYDLSRSWYDFLYHGHFEKYLMFLRSYHKAEQFLAATESSMGWLEIMASFLPAQLRALAPFVKFSGFNDEADTSFGRHDQRRSLILGRKAQEFLSELSKLLDKFKAERKVALAIASAGRGTWVTSLVIRTLNACLCARVPAEKYQEKFSEAFGIHVKLQPQNAD